jgi:hypothetical protein
MGLLRADKLMMVGAVGRLFESILFMGLALLFVKQAKFYSRYSSPEMIFKGFPKS